MNKRQAKKARKKVVFPLVDEMNLLTLSKEEYEEAMKDFHDWVWKHCRYKHYKDRYKKIFGFPCYRFPVGKEYMERRTKAILATTRRFPKVQEITQSIEQLHEMYPESKDI